MIDCIIVGQGLAGTCIATDLIENGLDCVVFDPGAEMTSSRLAAGVMNPVTGRRFVKTWNADVLWDEAALFYSWLEDCLDCDTLSVPRTIWQILRDDEVEEQWLLRTGDPEYASYLDPEVYERQIKGLQEHTYGQILNAQQADLPYLNQCGREYLERRDAFRNEKFILNELEVLDDYLEYQDLKSRYIIFAEGHHLASNPYFNWLPLNVTRGELLVCEIPGLKTEDIIKGAVSIVPMDGDLYWVGSTYTWEPEHASPSADGMAELFQGLKSMLDGPFVAEHHLAAIRPNTKDRRPFVGRHPEYHNMFIFNGLGTKGASLAPFCTRELSNCIREGSPIHEEVDILRYWPR